MSGEGYFEVQSDKEYPFYVSLDNGIKVKAHGTKFNINAYKEDRVVETTLEAGLVDVISASRTIWLKPNEQVCYDKEDGHFTTSVANIEEKTAWKEGKLVFRNATLEEVVKNYPEDITSISCYIGKTRKTISSELLSHRKVSHKYWIIYVWQLR